MIRGFRTLNSLQQEHQSIISYKCWNKTRTHTATHSKVSYFKETIYFDSMQAQKGNKKTKTMRIKNTNANNIRPTSALFANGGVEREHKKHVEFSNQCVEIYRYPNEPRLEYVYMSQIFSIQSKAIIEMLQVFIHQMTCLNFWPLSATNQKKHLQKVEN